MFLQGIALGEPDLQDACNFSLVIHREGDERFDPSLPAEFGAPEIARPRVCVPEIPRPTPKESHPKRPDSHTVDV